MVFCQRRGFWIFFFKDEDLHGVLSKTRILGFFKDEDLGFFLKTRIWIFFKDDDFG